MSGMGNLKDSNNIVVVLDGVDGTDWWCDFILGKRSQVVLIWRQKYTGVVMKGVEGTVGAWRIAYVAIKTTSLEAVHLNVIGRYRRCGWP